MRVRLLLPLILAAAAPAPADHVVLVSVDGLRPEFYLDRTWPAPMLQQMVAQGVHAEAVPDVVRRGRDAGVVDCGDEFTNP